MNPSITQGWIAVFIVSFCICFQSFGQEKLSKAEKKAQREAKSLAAKEANLAIAQTRRWVLESGTVYDRSGQSFQMNPTLNFIMINEDITTIQLDFGALVGWNGVGGITFDGKISKYEIKEGKPKQAFTIIIRSQGAVQGSVDLDFSIGSSAENVRANARGTWGDRITFSGRFVPLEESVVYKGQAFK